MKTTFAFSACVAIVIPLVAEAGGKTRIFVTESQPPQLAGDVAVGEMKGALAFTGGNSPQVTEVMKQFQRRCPDVIITANRERADYVVRFDHEEPSPVTPFVHGNKVAVFDENEDLVYSHSTRLLSNAVKGACTAIAAQGRR